jgi:hypothetical protein
VKTNPYIPATVRAVALSLATLTSVTMLTGCGTKDATTTASSTSSAPTQASSADAGIGAPSAGASTAGSGAGPSSIAGFPGVLYYIPESDDAGLSRLTGGKLITVLARDEAQFPAVSPDGGTFAEVDLNGVLRVTDGNGKNGRTLIKGVAGAGYEPAWSPDGSKILVGLQSGALGVVAVSNGAFTALAHNPQGIHYLWTGDGKHLVYATGECQIGVSAADGSGPRVVPNFGSKNAKVNPQRQRSCDPFSVSADGSRVAVNMRTGSQEDGDIGPDYAANAILDTTTGHTVPLSVSGTIAQILFVSGGQVLVRSRTGNTGSLTLLSASGSVVAKTTEPATTATASLVACLTG